MKHTILLTLAALLAAPLGANAQTVVHDPLLPSADTHVRGSNSASSNYGSANYNYISVRATTSSNKRYAYLQFDVSSITDPITNVTLTLTLSEDIASARTASTLQLYGLIFANDTEALALGLETSLNYNNAPAPWGSGSSSASATDLLSTVPLPIAGEAKSTAGSSFIFESSSQLVSFLEAARLNPDLSIVTLVLTESTGQTTNGEIFFASKENTTRARPTLTITTTAVPEPATWAAFAGLTLLVFAILRRRR
ncbi:DUF7594 domain-containing protein [Geminisphaera colitermitum]|uniref:CBM96 family carbohydrate-binding protein n=1 Tax=Geminisphaera colitermitum TaxID=1148786 RepID=UPI0005B9A9D4|nr:DNRLRE domain-containing protein [Geminisphaera colitermitum]